jgi:hypothetical protein
MLNFRQSDVCISATILAQQIAPAATTTMTPILMWILPTYSCSPKNSGARIALSVPEVGDINLIKAVYGELNCFPFAPFAEGGLGRFKCRC